MLRYGPHIEQFFGDSQFKDVLVGLEITAWKIFCWTDITPNHVQLVDKCFKHTKPLLFSLKISIIHFHSDLQTLVQSMMNIVKDSTLAKM